MPRNPLSGPSDGISDRRTLFEINRKLDEALLVLWGKRIDGTIEKDGGWCGRVEKQLEKIPGLERRMYIATGGLIVLAGIVKLLWR